jgi:Fe2+ transport system protein FeoA
VLIADRNAAAVRVLERELGKKHKKLAIFYGAAHLPEMEKRLLRLGFTRGAQAWLTAWRIGEKASASYQLP